MSLRLDLESVIERLRAAAREHGKAVDQLEDVLSAHLDGMVKPRPRVTPDLKALETSLTAGTFTSSTTPPPLGNQLAAQVNRK